jgi:hypothetical protein
MEEQPMLAEALGILAESIDRAIKVVQDIDRSNAPLVLRAYKQLSDNLDRLEDLEKRLSEAKNTMSYYTIPEVFESQGIDSMKVSGYNFVVGQRVNATIPAEMKNAGFTWLRDHGMGHLIQEAVNARSLSSVLKEYIAEHGDLPPETAIKVHAQTYTQVRKA